MKFRFVLRHAERYRIKVMCSVLGVSRSGYYAWKKRQPSARERANRGLKALIRLLHRKSRGTYGYRRVHAALVAQGVICGHGRVARLMRNEGLRARRRRRYKRTTQSQHSWPVAPNHLAQSFEASGPNKKWVTDITYVRTAEGWLYLAVVLDLYSRLVVGWAMEPSLTDVLTTKALKMAVGNRQPPPGLLHQSDRGSQYASGRYQRLLTTHYAFASMSRTGNVYDNAPMESFFATLKTELIHHRNYETRQQAKAEIFEFIEVFYNRQRLHSALGYMSPMAFESLSVSP
jgi:transposase InsO family protein